MEFTVGALLEGKVKSITKFGAFITLPENRTGMVHISEVANTYVSDIHDHLTEGQDVKVKVIGIDPAGKISLSIKRTHKFFVRNHFILTSPHFLGQYLGGWECTEMHILL